MVIVWWMCPLKMALVAGNLLHNYGNMAIEIVSFPSTNCDFSYLCESLPNGILIHGPFVLKDNYDYIFLMVTDLF